MRNETYRTLLRCDDDGVGGIVLNYINDLEEIKMAEKYAEAGFEKYGV